MSYVYAGTDQAVVSEASFSLKPGEVVGLAGPNGAGKTTLGKVAAGVLRPLSGDVLADSWDLISLRSRQRARLVRYAFQNPEAEYHKRTVNLELQVTARALGVDVHEFIERVSAIFAKFSVTLEMSAHPYDLDPWHRKLVSVCTALAARARYIVLDEPSVRLSYEHLVILSGEIRRMAEGGHGFLVISHHPELIDRAADSVMWLSSEGLSAKGSVGVVFARKDGRPRANAWSHPRRFLKLARTARSREC